MLIVVRLRAGPHVVGIAGALWRGFATCDAAMLAYQHAGLDGLLFEVELQEPEMPEMFLSLLD